LLDKKINISYGDTEDINRVLKKLNLEIDLHKS
jgi:hypothetical protein